MNQISKIIVGLDVHKETIVVAVLYPGVSQVSERFTIENTTEAIERMVKRLAGQGPVKLHLTLTPQTLDIQRAAACL